MTGEIIAIALGLLVGLSLGALGGGGSTLAVPVLVFIAGLAAQDATSASLLVVGVASAIGAWGHHRNGRVRLGAGVGFGAAGIVGSRVGTSINQSLDETTLLLAFSVLILFVAVRMLRSDARSSAAASASIAPDAADSGAADPGETPLAKSGHSPTKAPHATTTLQPATVSETSERFEFGAASVVKLVIAATGVGLLTGLFGVGGGFAVVPALTLILGFSTKDAIGTSLVVIAINTAVALGMRLGNLDFDWAVVLPFLATVTIGVLAGSRVASRVDAARLTKSFAVMLVVVAFYTAGGAILS